MFNSKILLGDVISTLNETTGKRTRELVNTQEVYADKQELGMNEFYSAKEIQQDLKFTFEIPKHLYNEQSFVIYNNKQYRIYRAGKGRSLAFIKLILISCKRTDLIGGYTIG